MLALFLFCVHSSENDQGEKEYFLKEILSEHGLIICVYKEQSVLLFILYPAALKHFL